MCTTNIQIILLHYILMQSYEELFQIKPYSNAMVMYNNQSVDLNKKFIGNVSNEILKRLYKSELYIEIIIKSDQKRGFEMWTEIANLVAELKTNYLHRMVNHIYILIDHKDKLGDVIMRELGNICTDTYVEITHPLYYSDFDLLKLEREFDLTRSNQLIFRYVPMQMETIIDNSALPITRSEFFAKKNKLFHPKTSIITSFKKLLKNYKIK